MADAVEATEQDLEIARQGIRTQLEAHCPNEDFTVLASFLENQAQVIANQRAYIRFLNTALHPK